MKIIYKKDTMVIEHPSGHVDRYSKAYLEKLKRDAEREFQDANDSVIDINKHIINVELQE